MLNNPQIIWVSVGRDVQVYSLDWQAAATADEGVAA